MTSNELREAQSRLKMTNAELAAALLLSVRMVEDMRAGRRNVAVRTERLLRYLLATAPAKDGALVVSTLANA